MDLETGKAPGDLLDGSILAHVIEGAPVGFGMHDAAGKVTYVNRYLADLLGFDDAAELLGCDVTLLVCEADREGYRKRLTSRPAEHGDPYSLRVTRKDGVDVRILVRPVPILDKAGEIVAEAAFILDIAVLDEHRASSEPRGVPSALLEELTAREREIFDRLVEGKAVREIAEESFISEHTVRNHIKSVYRKLDLHSRLDLMRAVLGR